MFDNAIVRTPSPSLINGLTMSPELGVPNYELALKQHQEYIHALTQCGVEVTVLDALDDYPDSCFVEDPALLTEQFALLTRPGAPTRQGEVAEIEPTIHSFYKNRIERIAAPGTLEAGDVLRVGNHFFVGLSARTNEEGARQMMEFMTQYGYTASTVALKEFLHLKTGVSYLEQGTVLVTGELVDHPALSHLRQIIVPETETYAANCIIVNGTVILAQNYPQTEQLIAQLGFPLLLLDMSEFKKVDGGLSCLSLRF